MIDFRKYSKPKSPSYFGFREIEPEELRTIFSKNSGYAKLVGAIECFLGNSGNGEEEFFVLRGNKMTRRVCTLVNEILEGDSWAAKKLYFLDSADLLRFMSNVGRVYSSIPYYDYIGITTVATKKPLILLVREDAKF
jgi:hypothetical protein